jgi:hypothetical protein
MKFLPHVPMTNDSEKIKQAEWSLNMCVSHEEITQKKSTDA